MEVQPEQLAATISELQRAGRSLTFVHQFDQNAWHRLVIKRGRRIAATGEWHGYEQAAQVTLGHHTYEAFTEFRADPNVVREIRTIGQRAKVVQIAGVRPT